MRDAALSASLLPSLSPTAPRRVVVRGEHESKKSLVRLRLLHLVDHVAPSPVACLQPRLSPSACSPSGAAATRMTAHTVVPPRHLVVVVGCRRSEEGQRLPPPRGDRPARRVVGRRRLAARRVLAVADSGHAGPACAREPAHVHLDMFGATAVLVPGPETRGPRAERGRRAPVRCDGRPSCSRVPARAARCAYPAVACAWPAAGEQGNHGKKWRTCVERCRLLVL